MKIIDSRFKTRRRVYTCKVKYPNVTVSILIHTFIGVNFMKIKQLLTAFFLLFCSTLTLAGFNNSGTIETKYLTINSNTLTNSGVLIGSEVAEIDLTDRLDNTNGTIAGKIVNIYAPNISSLNDKELGRVCWKNSFILNGMNVSVHNSNCKNFKF